MTLVNVGKTSCHNVWRLLVRDDDGHFEAINLNDVFIKLPSSFKKRKEPMDLDEE